MYILYIANKNYSSWSLRPWLLMQQLAIPSQERMVPFTTGSNWEQFRHFSPTGRVPCLRDQEIYIWDSLAITEYLAERYPAVWPQDSKVRAWARSAVAEMHSGFQTLRDHCPMNCALRVQLHEMAAPLTRDIRRIDELWCDGLNRHGGPYLTGSAFTAVDAFFAPVAYRVQTYSLKLSSAATAYVDQLLSLAAMRNWYDAALTEPWREQHHEEEASQRGTVLKDYRISPSV